MVSLAPDEIVLLQGLASYNGTRGTVYLTNRKLTFDFEKRGLIFKGQYTALDLPLERISALSIVGVSIFRKLAINLVKNGQSFGVLRHEFKMDNPEQWMTEIEVARRTQKESMFTIQKEYRELTREIVKIKCMYCGMLVDQHLAQCPNCGSLVR